jgi:hypothetical protein
MKSTVLSLIPDTLFLVTFVTFEVQKKIIQ